MTSLQAAKRSLSLSPSVIMAPVTFLKDTGCTVILRILLLGIFLPSVLVSGQTTSPAVMMSYNSSNASVTSATQNFNATAITAISNSTLPPTSMTYVATGNVTVTQMSNSSTSGAASTTTVQPPMMNATSTASNTTSKVSNVTNQPSMNTNSATSGSAATTLSASSTTSGGGSAANTMSSGAMTASGSTSSSSSMTSVSGSSTSMMSTNQSSNYTGGMSGMNETTMPNSTWMSMIYCPSFMCNYSDCYTMYTSMNATLCPAGACCELIRWVDMCYTAGCSFSCADSCVNASQTNCSVNCCNSTGCLNDSFASMMVPMTTVTPTTTTSTTARTTPATSPQTTADNGKKCHQGKCTGAKCYTDFQKAPLQTCSSSEPHCQLQKETISSGTQWTAGCTTNCSGKASCKKESTKPPCHLECCNATLTSSCLWLNGSLNVPSFATRGPHLNTELISSVLCLLALALLL